MKKLRFILQAAFCCLLWGTAIPVLKISYELLELPASDFFNRLVLAGMRFFLAGFFIFLYVLMRHKETIKVSRNIWTMILIFGLLNTTLQYMFFYMGVGNTQAIKGTLLDTSKPLIVVILAHFFTKDDRIDGAKIIGLILGFVGIIIANIETALQGVTLSFSLQGEGCLLIASLSNAIAVLYGKRVMKVMSSTILNMYQMMFGAIVMLVIGLIGAGGYHLNFGAEATVLLIYSSILSAVAFVLWYKLLANHDASKVSVYIFLIPVFGSIISSSVFPDEHISFNVLLSLLLLTVAIFLVNRKKKLNIDG